jgi:hypothetical protein
LDQKRQDKNITDLEVEFNKQNKVIVSQQNKVDQFIQSAQLDQKRQDTNITDLKQKIASLEKDLESFNKRLLISENKNQISKIQAGILNLVVYRILTIKKTLMFNQPFSNIPQMFFTLRNVHIGNNLAPLWTITNLNINRNQWSIFKTST